MSITTETTGRLGSADADQVQRDLQELLLDQACKPGNTAGPMFRSKPLLVEGALKLWCLNQHTVDWLTGAVKSIKLSSGTTLMVKRQDELFRRIRCGILLPGIWNDAKRVGHALQFQNPWAEVRRWLLHKMDHLRNGQYPRGY